MPYFTLYKLPILLLQAPMESQICVKFVSNLFYSLQFLYTFFWTPAGRSETRNRVLRDEEFRARN